MIFGPKCVHVITPWEVAGLGLHHNNIFIGVHVDFTGFPLFDVQPAACARLTRRIHCINILHDQHLTKHKQGWVVTIASWKESLDTMWTVGRGQGDTRLCVGIVWIESEQTSYHQDGHLYLLKQAWKVKAALLLFACFCLSLLVSAWALFGLA